MQQHMDLSRLKPENFQKVKPEDLKKKNETKNPVSNYSQTPETKHPTKKNIFLLWLLSTITFGIYSAVWYFKRANELNNLGTQKKLKTTIPSTLLVINIILIALIIILPLTITTETGVFFQYITTAQGIILFLIGLTAILTFFLTLLSAFHTRTIINQALSNKGSHTSVSALFTLFFTHLYLQYEINKIMDDKEETKKKGPWFFFILLILIAVTGVVLSVI